MELENHMVLGANYGDEKPAKDHDYVDEYAVAIDRERAADRRMVMSATKPLDLFGMADSICRPGHAFEVNDGRHNRELIAAERDEAILNMDDSLAVARIDRDLAKIVADAALNITAAPGPISSGAIVAALNAAAHAGYEYGRRK